MAERNQIIIGTRGSKLSLAKTKLVIDALKRLHAERSPGSSDLLPKLSISTKIIATKGDVNQSPIPADAIGKRWFTAEIEAALANDEIDIAVHSLKDMPQGNLPENSDGSDELVAVPVLERGDPRDVLISKLGVSLKDLPKGAIIGTDSVRRRVLLLEQRPDFFVNSIRGNVDTRLKKLATENYDAIVLAAAGLARVDMTSAVTEFLDASVFIPAIGQGILVAQVRKDRPELLELLQGIGHAPTVAAAQAEQAFSRAVGGGCKLPIGCYARVEGEKIFIDAMIGDEATNRIARKSASGAIGDGVALAEAMAKELIAEQKRQNST